MALLWMLVQYSGIGNEYMDDALFFERQENCIETFQLLSIQYNPSGCFIGAAAYTHRHNFSNDFPVRNSFWQSAESSVKDAFNNKLPGRCLPAVAWRE